MDSNAESGQIMHYYKRNLGERILIGSTTQLTTGGFSDYLEQVYSYGANLGVLFTASRGEYE